MTIQQHFKSNGYVHLKNALEWCTSVVVEKVDTELRPQPCSESESLVGPQ